MKQVIILRAISGAGKSTYARSLPAQVVCSADDYFTVDGEYRFDKTKLGEAHGACFRKYIQALQERADGLVVVDNTNIGVVEIAPYMLAASAYGWAAELHELRVTLEVAVARNVHKVPHEVLQHMIAGLDAERIPPWWTVVRIEAPDVPLSQDASNVARSVL